MVKFKYYKTRASFDTDLGNSTIHQDDVVFLEEGKLVWTHGVFYSQSEIAISDTEPTNNEKIWIDTSDTSSISVVEEAPKDGKAYIRKNGQWIEHQEQEVYVGTTEPSEDLDCDIWINPETGEIHYKNSESGSWEVIEGGGIGEITETVKVSLTSNQTNPNAELNGAKVTVTYSGNITREQVWAGSELTFNIPTGQEYTVAVSAIQDYATPETQQYTAIAGETRNLTFTYNTTVVSVTVSGVTSATATVTGSSTSNLTFSAGVMTQTFRVPTGQAYTVTFSEVSGYATPAQISTTAAGATQSHNADYSNTTVNVTIGSNQSDFNSSVTATINYTGGSDNKQVTGKGSVSFSIPYGVSYTITFSAVSGYRTPTQISDTANSGTKTHSVSYDATRVTVNITSNHGTTDIGSARATINGTQYSNGQTLLVPTGSSAQATFNSITGYKTPNAQTISTSGATATVTGTYQSEWVTVNVSGISSGFTITISGGFSASQTSASQTHKIPYGTSYTVSASNVNGYTAPSNQQFTAGSNTRTVTMTYAEIVNGVFIYDNTGGLTSYSSWNTSNNSKAVGVAVITDNTRMCVKKGVNAKNSIAWSDQLYGTDVPGVNNNSNETDYEGQSNTDAIRSAATNENSSNNAAHYCYSQTITVNGRTIHGYLPASGELKDLYNNKSGVESSLALIGNTTIADATNNNWLWSSTESASTPAYSARVKGWGSGSTSYTNKDSVATNRYALPCFPID